MRVRVRVVGLELEAEGDAGLIGQIARFVGAGLRAQRSVDVEIARARRLFGRVPTTGAGAPRGKRQQAGPLLLAPVEASPSRTRRRRRPV